MMTLAPQLLAILVCPQCRGELEHRADVPALDCPACALRYPIRDGIPIMLIDEATPLSARLSRRGTPRTPGGGRVRLS